MSVVVYTIAQLNTEATTTVRKAGHNNISYICMLHAEDITYIFCDLCSTLLPHLNPKFPTGSSLACALHARLSHGP